MQITNSIIPTFLSQSQDKVLPKPRMFRTNLIALLFALCLIANFCSGVIGSEAAQELSFLALMLPIFLMFNFKMVRVTPSFKVYANALPYIAALFISFIFSIDSDDETTIRDFVLFFNTALALFLASIIGGGGVNNTEELYLRIMKFFSFLALPILIYIAYSQRTALVWGRWTPYGLQPNWWGMMAMGFAWSALAWKSIFLRLFFLL